MRSWLIILFIFALTITYVVEARKSHKPKLKLKGDHHKHKKADIKMAKHHKHKKAHIKIAKPHTHKHVHHKGIHHDKPKTVKPMPPPLIHSATPAVRYSPPFTGIDNGQIPHGNQVDLILDYLTKIESTIDVFLRLQGTYPDGSQEQRLVVKNVYPPLRVLLEAQHTHDYSIQNK